MKTKYIIFIILIAILVCGICSNEKNDVYIFQKKEQRIEVFNVSEIKIITYNCTLEEMKRAVTNQNKISEIVEFLQKMEETDISISEIDADYPAGAPKYGLEIIMNNGTVHYIYITLLETKNDWVYYDVNDGANRMIKKSKTRIMNIIW